MQLKEISYLKKEDLSLLISRNKDTLKILKDLGIEIGFNDNMTIDNEKNMKKINNSFLEIARQDHATIIKMMNK